MSDVTPIGDSNDGKRPLRNPTFRAGTIMSRFFPGLTLSKSNLPKFSALACFSGENSRSTYSTSDIRALKLAMYAEKKHFPSTELRKPVVIPVRIAKGGTGKTTVVGNIATAMAQMGYRVLCIDGDAQGNLTNMMGISAIHDQNIRHIGHLIGQTNPPRLTDSFIEGAIRPIFPDNMLDIIPADLTLSEIDSFLAKQIRRETIVDRLISDHLAIFGRYDVIFLDSASDSSMLEYNLMIAGKIVLAPVKPEPISFQALELLRSNITEINNNFPNKNLTIEIVLNNVNFAYGHVADCIRGLVTTYGNWVNMSVIPTKADFERNYNVNPEESMGTVVEQFPNRAASVSILELSYSLLARYKILLSGIKESMIQENTASANSTLENIATMPQEAVL